MPHLDAAALSLDSNGLDFLGKVLETPANFAIPRKAFDVPASNTGLSDVLVECEVNRPRRLEAMVEAV